LKIGLLDLLKDVLASEPHLGEISEGIGEGYFGEYYSPKPSSYQDDGPLSMMSYETLRF